MTLKSTNLIQTLCYIFLCCSTSSWAQPFALIRQELKSNWLFKQVRGTNYYPATVPGVVHTDLIQNNLLEDPYFRLNERSAQWVDKEDWEYITTLTPDPTIFEKENILLHFKGLDTYADVYLNDSLILKTNNMFREWRVDVKRVLTRGENKLRVHLHSPIKIDIPHFDTLHYPVEAGNDQSENGGLFDKKVSVFARKAGYHYGWDWGPRLVTSGIWRPVYLIGWSSLCIDNIHYQQTKVTAKKAHINVLVQVTSDTESMATVNVSAKELSTQWGKNIKLKKGTNRIELPIQINNPQLWWTNGLGEPYLYTFTTSVEINGVVDEATHKIGLRSLEVVRDKDEAGTSFYFRLNGVNLFTKGANYIPQDNFLPRVTPEQYQKTILDAVNANMNMLRVWGGGIYEDDLFYELCDKHGILVWQDFMFACSIYPMNSERLENIKQEAIDNVTRLRNHPCIALWCGNNEMHTAWFNWGWWRKFEKLGVLEELRTDYKILFHDLLQEVVDEYAPTIFYWPSSPYGGDPDSKCESGKHNWNPNGDAHYWGVWHGKDSIANYNHIKARYFSEYGFQSFPEYQSILKYAPDTIDHNIYSEVMMAHQRGGTHANKLIEWYLLNEYRKPKDFQAHLYMGQLLQGDAIRTAIEAHRRDMPYCMGTLYWQHNDCWPVASWSSRDYYGRWKAQHYFAKKAFDDILVSPITDSLNHLTVFVVSDRLHPTTGVLEVSIVNLQGELLSQAKKRITLPANNSHLHYSSPLSDLLKGYAPHQVAVEVTFTETKSSKRYTNSYLLSRCKEIDFPKTTIKRTVSPHSEGFRITLQSDKFARGVFLSLEGIDNFFSDNYFDLFPHRPVTIDVKTTLTQLEFERQLQCITLSDAY